MTKKNILMIILDSIFIVAFNILFFVNAGTSHSLGVWTCYGFLHFSYLMILLTPLIETKSTYLSWLTTYSISFSYFLLELVFAVMFFVNVDAFGTKVVVSIQTILTAIYFVLLVSNLLVNDATAKKQTRHDMENDFVKSISVKAKYIESIAQNSKLKSRINNLYYTIHSSPIKSSAEVSVYENKISDLLDNLETAVTQVNEEKANELAGEIERVVTKRNFILKSRN
ncbi:hypothetical protein [uncultured Treponema sp.]|uniref:hypothetical protein n=1 Tax=uncultured Treponema sp. TaxID=162155 RepID=UPI0025D085E4|nr:hypothetical protein [uncultured Treponema sp.]